MKDCVTFVQIYLAEMMQCPQRCVVVNAVIILYSFSISTSKAISRIPVIEYLVDAAQYNEKE